MSDTANQNAAPGQTIPIKRRKLSLAVISSSLLVILVVGAAGLYGRLLYRCIHWVETGLETDVETQPVTVIRNLARLVSEPVCENHLEAPVWAQLGAAYDHVPSVEDINRRRSLGAYQQAVTLAPKQIEYQQNLTKGFVNIGQFNYALRPAADAFEARPDDDEILRMLVTTYISIEKRPSAAALLIAAYGAGNPMPLWAHIAVETILHPVVDEENAMLLSLIDRDGVDQATALNRRLALAFRLGLFGDEAAMRAALSAISLTNVEPDDLLDAVKLYEQLGLTVQVIDGLLAKRAEHQLNNQEKLRLIRSLWLQQRHQDILNIFADDVRFQRFVPEGGLILSLAAHELRETINFASLLRETGDQHSQWDTTLMGLQQAFNNPHGVYAEELIDHGLAVRQFLPQSGVLSIMNAAIWQALDEPELVQNNLTAARLAMGAPLTDLERIPQPNLNLRPDPARDELVRCSPENLTTIDGTAADTDAVLACWDGLMAEFPDSMLLIRAALSDPRLQDATEKRREYLAALEQNSPNQAAFWRRAKARDLLSGQPDSIAATEALLLLRPLMQQPQPRPDTLLLTASAYSALRDISRSFQYLSEAILLQPRYAPAVHGLSLDIYQDQPLLLPRTLIQWWEVFAVLEARAMFGGHNQADTRQLLADVLQRRYQAMQNWATQQSDERLLVALTRVLVEQPNRPTEGPTGREVE